MTSSYPSNKFKNVVMFSLDCVRREALDCYPQRFPWRARVLSVAGTPTINKLCAGGVRFDQAVTHAPFTPAAHASLFTGLIPPKHGIRRLLGARLGEDVNTLAELLSAVGWQCGAVVSAYSLSDEYGFARGFMHYSGMTEGARDHRVLRHASEVTEQTINWLNSVEQDRPIFLFVHYFDAHNVHSTALSPTLDSNNNTTTKSFRHTVRDTLPDSLRSGFRWFDKNIRHLYYAVVKITQSASGWFFGIFEAGRYYKHEGRRFMLQSTSEIDAQIGRVIHSLAERDQLDDTLIILLADHGDDFWQHGEPTHRQFLYDTTLLVPLIIYPKIGNRGIVSDQVRLVDVLPTILELLDLETKDDIDGESLLPLLDEAYHREMMHDSLKAYSETVFEIKENEASQGEIKTCHSSLREYPWKLIWDRLGNNHELYRIDLDPNETNNLVEVHPDILLKLSVELQQLAQEMPIDNGPVDDLMVERLKALGYL